MAKFSERDQIPYRYGLDELPVDITHRELLYFFSFNPTERQFVREKGRFPAHQIVLGIHLAAYRFIGRTQYYPENTPSIIIKHVAGSLNLDGDVIPLIYSDRERTRRDHIKIAREFMGLDLFHPANHQRLIENLIQNAPDPGHIPAWIISAEDFLRANQFVLPTVEVLRRLILSARNQTMENVVSYINSQLNEERIARLDRLLESQNETGAFWNSVIDKNVYSPTTRKIAMALEHIKGIRELSLKEIDLGSIPLSHVRYLAQQGIHLNALRLKTYTPSRKYAIVVVTLAELESDLIDVVIQMNDEILAGVYQRAQSRTEKYYKKHRRMVTRVIHAFRFMSHIHLDEGLSPLEKSARINENLPPEKLRAIRDETDIIDIPRGSEKLYFASQGYQTIEKYLPKLLETIQMISPSKADPVLEAADYYLKRRLEGKRGIGQDAPTGFVQEARWKRIVFDSNGRVKSKAWVLCLTDKLRTAFRQGSLEIQGARQYRSLNSDLIPWPEWKSMEIKANAELPFTYSAEEVFNALSSSITGLCGKFKHYLDLESPPAQIDKKNRLHLTKLDKQDVRESVKNLKKLLHQRMPKVSLPDILSHVDKFVGYSAHFTRLSSGDSIQREGPASLSFYALILASVCNIPLPKMAENPGLNVALLETLREDIIRPQTIQAAIASLVEFYSRLPLAQIWGEGGTSSSDGQGFAAASHPLGAVYHRQRFRRKRRGFIVYTHILDNYAPFYTQVIPASAREAIYVLDGLLYHALSLMPREHYTDSHGYTDIVFALTYLLGFRLAPRMAKLPDLTLWYGKGYNVEFQELFDGRITRESIANQWEAVQRISATIQNGRTRASQIIRKVSAFNRKHSLFKGLRNLGRLVRTRHILEVAGDKEYRKRILQELNKGESRNSLEKDLRYARQGIIREKDPDMRLCVVSVINLMILCLAIWNTIYMQRAIRSLKEEGYQINQEDLGYLSPFGHAHINLY